jgi:hypothetical protein
MEQETTSLAALLGNAVPASEIKTTQGNAYVRGHYAIRTANRIFGPLGWQVTILDTVLVQDEIKKGNTGENTYIGYTMAVRLTATFEGQTKTTEDVGFGQGINKDRGQANEKAIKEARTDALKRCLKDLGDAFGLHLYDNGSREVPNDPAAAPTRNATKAAPMNPGDYAQFIEAGKKAGLKGKEGKDLWSAICEKFPADGSASDEALTYGLAQIEAMA